MREIHVVKETLEFHDSESQNISGESIGGAALINYFVPDAALIQVNTVHIPVPYINLTISYP